MTIRINQTIVDFTLETERTLSDLLKALQSWADSQDLAILSVLADGRSFDASDARDLVAVHEVDVEAVSRSAHDAAKLSVIADYFQLLKSAAVDGNQKALAELSPEYSAVRAGFVGLTANLKERTSAALEVLDAAWVDLPRLAAASDTLAQAAETTRDELLDPQGALRETLARLDARLESLSGLSQLFQRGKDREAFSLILELFTLLEDANRRASLVLANEGSAAEPWKAFQEELQPFLRETQDALAAGDYILLTDLLEYEVIPRIVGVKELFPGISKLDPVGDLP